MQGDLPGQGKEELEVREGLQCFPHAVAAPLGRNHSPIRRLALSVQLLQGRADANGPTALFIHFALHELMEVLDGVQAVAGVQRMRSNDAFAPTASRVGQALGEKVGVSLYRETVHAAVVLVVVVAAPPDAARHVQGLGERCGLEGEAALLAEGERQRPVVDT